MRRGLKMEPIWILLAILIVAALGKAYSVAAATGLLLVIKLLQADRVAFPFLEKNGVFIGLVSLIAAILIPIARGQIGKVDLWHSFTSGTGLIALILSLLTTYLSGLGMRYLMVEGNSAVMPALIIGAVAAAAFLGGVPVGPLITSGLMAVLVKWFSKG